MISRLMFLSLMSASIFGSLSLPVYGKTPSVLLVKNQKVSSRLAQNSTADADKLFKQGEELYRSGKYSQAVEVYQRVLKIRRQQGDKVGINSAELFLLDSIGDAYFAQNKLEEGDKYFQQALSVVRELKNEQLKASIIAKIITKYSNFAKKYNSEKEYQKAIKVGQKGWNIAKKNQASTYGIAVLIELFTAYEKLSNYDKIIEIAQEARKFSQNSKIRKEEAELVKILLKLQGNQYSLRLSNSTC